MDPIAHFVSPGKCQNVPQVENRGNRWRAGWDALTKAQSPIQAATRQPLLFDSITSSSRRQSDENLIEFFYFFISYSKKILIYEILCDNPNYGIGQLKTDSVPCWVGKFGKPRQPTVIIRDVGGLRRRASLFACRTFCSVISYSVATEFYMRVFYFSAPDHSSRLTPQAFVPLYALRSIRPSVLEVQNPPQKEKRHDVMVWERLTIHQPVVLAYDTIGESYNHRHRHGPGAEKNTVTNDRHFYTDRKRL